MVTSGGIEKLNILGETLLQTDNAEDALVAYDAALGLDPNDKQALAGKTVSLLDLGRFEAASHNADSAVQKHPEDASLWRLLGEATLAAGKGELAIRAFSNYQKLHGVTVWSSIKLAEASYFIFDIERARKFIVVAQQKEPDNPDARILQERLGKLNDSNAILIDVGKAHCRQGRLQQGVGLFRQALSLEDSVQARQNLARGLLILGQLEEAISHLKVVIERNSGNLEALTDLATTYLLSGDMEEAQRSFVRVLSLRPNDYDALVGMARIALNAGNLNEAQNYIEQADRLDSFQPEVWLLKARLHSTRGQAVEARRYIDHAIALDASLAPAWVIGNEILRNHGMHTLAALYLDKARQLAPGQVRTEATPSQGEFTELEIDMADLEDLNDPVEFTQACKDRSAIYAAIGEIKHALHCLDLLRKRYPETVDEQLINQQGVLLLSIEETRQARHCFEQVLALNNSNRVAQQGLIAIAEILERQVQMKDEQEHTGRVENVLTTGKTKAAVQHTEKNVETVLGEKPKFEGKKPETKVFCRKCGHKLSIETKFCNRCGTPRR